MDFATAITKLHVIQPISHNTRFQVYGQEIGKCIEYNPTGYKTLSLWTTIIRHTFRYIHQRLGHKIYTRAEEQK